ncbi:hypothetical protein KHA80_18845 [Anaerobacillus sp. HL2]|nr:hypothetical protein KHA80_18845 [Anaerobacillus sp. HL2]
METISQNLFVSLFISVKMAIIRYFPNLGKYLKKTSQIRRSMFSICSIRGKLTIEKLGIAKAYAPFYDGHHLIGVCLLNVRTQL